MIIHGNRLVGVGPIGTSYFIFATSCWPYLLSARSLNTVLHQFPTSPVDDILPFQVFPKPPATKYTQPQSCQRQTLTSSLYLLNSFSQSTSTPSHHILPMHLPFSPPPSLRPTSTDSRSCTPSGTATRYKAAPHTSKAFIFTNLVPASASFSVRCLSLRLWLEWRERVG